MIAVGLGLGAAAGARAATPSIEMPVGELATESWDWVARLDTGDWLLAQAVLSNLGPGDRHAAVLGRLVAADGTVEVFKRSEPEGKWQLTEAGRRLDLRSIAFAPFGPTQRFEVARDALGLDLTVRGSARPAFAGGAADCSLSLLEASAPAQARLRRGAGSPWLTTPARVALTHRRASDLETSCLSRRVEVFALEGAVGVYFSETTAPDGSIDPLVVATRDGRMIFAGAPDAARVAWSVARDGFAPPASARFAARDLSGSVGFGATLASVDPIERLPAAVRWLVATRTKPRIAWQRAPFEITVAGQTLRGEGVAKITYSNPLPGGRVPARVAVHSEE